MSHVHNDNQEKGSESRIFPRKKIALGLTYSVLTSMQGVGMIKDISEGGFRFMTDQRIPKGTLIMAKFNLPEDGHNQSVETVAKVVWCKKEEDGYVIGVRALT